MKEDLLIKNKATAKSASTRQRIKMNIDVIRSFLWNFYTLSPMKLFTVKFTFCSELEKVLLTDLYKQVALKAEFSNSPVMTSESNNQRNPIQKNIAIETEYRKTAI